MRDFDNVAPSVQHCELQDMSKDTNPEEEGGQIFTEYDIGQDIGCPGASGTDVTEELIKNRVSDQQFRADVRSLNRRQREVFLHVLKSVKTSDKQFFLFLTGGAGVGKSRVTKTLYQALIRHYNTVPGTNPEQKHILLTATTGKAAFLIEGYTLHTAFIVPAKQSLAEYKPLAASTLNTLRTRIGELKVLFIDEISMCGGNLFKFIDHRLQDIKQVNLPFGGVSVIAIGDLFQLRPVQDHWIFSYPQRDDLSILAPNVWLDRMKIFELTEIMRQAGDKRFAEALNNIREGNITTADTNLLKTRVISKGSSDYPITATHIMYYRDSVNDHNNKAYNNCSGDKVLFTAQDIVIGDVTPEIKKKILEKAPVGAGDAMGLAKTFKTAIGLRNELTINLDVEDGLVNGAGGTTQFVTYNSSGQPKIIWVQFDEEAIGKEKRRHNKHLYSAQTKLTWTPISPVVRQFPIGRYKNVKLQRSQFPLQLASAKTVHRSQGDTMNEIVVQLPSQRRMHLHYVAFSRVTSLEGLHILQPFDPSKITVSEDVSLEMDRLRQQCQISLSYTPLYSIQEPGLKICCHNSQSVKLHLEDIKSEPNFQSSDILMFTESKLSKKDLDVSIPDFITHRFDFSTSQTPYGILLYSKQNVNCTSKKCMMNESLSSVEVVLLIVEQPIKLALLCVYSRPKEKWETLSNALTCAVTQLPMDRPCIIMGDFNTHDSTFNRLCSLLNQYQLNQILKESTTNLNTMIDLVFTNLDSNRYRCGTLESYYSYHKPVWVFVSNQF